MLADAKNLDDLEFQQNRSESEYVSRVLELEGPVRTCHIPLHIRHACNSLSYQANPDPQAHAMQPPAGFPPI